MNLANKQCFAKLISIKFFVQYELHWLVTNSPNLFLAKNPFVANLKFSPTILPAILYSEGR